MKEKDKTMNAKNVDFKWKDLYRIGFISCIASFILILFAIVAYFIWPYIPGETSVVSNGNARTCVLPNNLTCSFF